MSYPPQPIRMPLVISISAGFVLPEIDVCRCILVAQDFRDVSRLAKEAVGYMKLYLACLFASRPRKWWPSLGDHIHTLLTMMADQTVLCELMCIISSHYS